MSADALASCTLDTCPLDTAIYGYRPSLGANATFLTIAGVCLISYAAIYAATRQWLTYLLLVSLGCLVNLVGYVARVLAWNNPWDLNIYIINSVCLNISPVFICAAIYMSLRDIAHALGPEHSFVRPEWFGRIFVTADIICLFVHGAGGGIAFTGDMSSAGASNPGIQTITAALALQVVSLAVFLALFISILVRSFLSRRAYVSVAQSADRLEKDRRPVTTRFKLYVAMILVVCACIIVRCIYRAAAYSGGFTSALNQNQAVFIGLDSTMIAIALSGLAIFTPAVFLR